MDESTKAIFEFQFYKVRLKQGLGPDRGGEEVFQFYKVRLKRVGLPDVVALFLDFNSTKFD